MNVRPLRGDEGQLLKRLSIAMCAEVPTAFYLTTAEAEARTDEMWQQLAEEFASSPDKEAFVGENSGDPCGFVSATRLPRHMVALVEGQGEHDESRDEDGDELTDTTLLGSMYVAPNVRGQGLAQCLIEAVLSWARENNQRRVVLGVTQGNERALRCYIRAEFLPMGVSVPHMKFEGVMIDLMEYVL